MSSSTEKQTWRTGLLRSLTCVAAFSAIGFTLVADYLIEGSTPGLGGRQRFVLLVGVVLAGVWFALLARDSKGRVALAMLSLVLTVCAAEVVLARCVGRYYAAVFQLDEDCVYTLAPDTERYYRTAPLRKGEKNLVRINSSGYRGEELGCQEGARRIVVYGDSFIASEFTPLADTFVEKLGAKLCEGANRRVEMVNAGVPGYGPDQIALRMERELPSLQPDLVVVALLAENDFGDPIRNKLFRLTEAGALVKNDYVMTPFLQHSIGRHARLPILVRMFEDVVIKKTAHAADCATDRERLDFLRRECVIEYRQFVLKGNNTVKNLFWDHHDADLRLTPGCESARYKVRFMRALCGRIADVAERNGVALVLVIIPAAADVIDDYDVDVVDPEAFPGYRRRNLSGAFECIASELNVDHLNLFDSFRESGGDLYHRGGDTHWNEAGQELAAEEMARFLHDRELLE